jgi:hypothetical protein
MPSCRPQRQGHRTRRRVLNAACDRSELLRHHVEEYCNESWSDTAVLTRSSPLPAWCHTHWQVSTDSDTSAACPCLVTAAKYQSEISHNVTDVRSGKAGCLDFHKVAYAGHGLSVLLTAVAGGRSRTYVAEGTVLHQIIFRLGHDQRICQCAWARACLLPPNLEANTGQTQRRGRQQQCYMESSVTQTLVIATVW